jgi:hypothetical protein
MWVRVLLLFHVGVSQLVESNLAKVDVEGSSPFTYSDYFVLVV